ncbi:hypothetical protein PCCS19_37210 [Paenibacillus sp. CCS19]|nr:hypothetical protein PCCS19_37210 [Paenibacillus cellulosilyticus]
MTPHLQLLIEYLEIEYLNIEIIIKRGLLIVNMLFFNTSDALFITEKTSLARKACG